MSLKTLGPGLNARQLAALEANAPTTEDILENPEFLEELNNEIRGTYDQPQELVVQQPEPVKRRTLSAPSRKDILSPEEELELLSQQADKKLAKKKEEAKTVEPEPAPVATSPEEMIREQILSALHEAPQRPSDADIAKWKREYGDSGVYVSALNEQDIFVFTYLRRSAWQKIQGVVQKAQASELTTNPDDMLKEKVLQFCVLWPRPLTIEFFSGSRAGTVDTLFNIIMAHSSFLQLNQAMILTTQL